MNRKHLPHGITVLAFALFVVLGLACASAPPPDQRANSQSSSQTQRQQQAGSQTTQAVQYFTGDGARSISITILAPQATGLAEDQGYLPSLAQGEFVSNFTGYSAISVLDRVRLDEQYAELFSGYYDDNAEETWDFGHLSPTSHILGGVITRTSTGYNLQMHITKTADKMTVASYSNISTFAELDNLSAIRRASLDLLQQLGVIPTTRTQEELARAAPENHVSAQTALAQGITAQQQGKEVAALSYYLQASTFDPSLQEAASRTSILSANLENAVPYSTTISGSITTTNTSNRYTLVVLLPGRVSVNITSDGTSAALPNQGADVFWLDADGTRIRGSNNGFTFPYNDSMDLNPGIYNIDIVGRSGIGNSGRYTISVDYTTDKKEPNNTRATAQLLVSGLTVRGSITNQDKTDMYRYELTRPGRLSVNVTLGETNTGGLHDAYVKWYSVNGTEIRGSNPTRTYNEYMDLEAGNYFIEITPYGGYTGTYNLRGDFTAAGSNAIKPNNTRATAQLLTSGQTVRGFISNQEKNEMYRYELTRSGRMTVNVALGETNTGGLHDAYVKWYSVNGTEIKGSNPTRTYNEYMDLEAGNYFIEITPYGGYTGTYNLRGDFTAAGSNAIKPNNTRATAQLLISGQTVRGFISNQEKTELYRYELTRSGRMTVNVALGETNTGGLYDAYVKWYDVNGREIKSSNPTRTYNEYMDLEAGNYFIEITPYGGYTGTYNLSIRAQ